MKIVEQQYFEKKILQDGQLVHTEPIYSKYEPCLVQQPVAVEPPLLDLRKSEEPITKPLTQEQRELKRKEI